MRWRWLWSGVAVLLVLAPAAAPASDVAIVGRVIDASLSGPAAGIHAATVKLTIPGADGGVTTATTDALGAFAITLPPGDESYVFTSVSAVGFYPFGQWTSGAALRATSPLIYALQPAPPRVFTMVAGVVYDASIGPSAPIEGAEVRYLYRSYMDAFPEVSGTLHTGADGAYVIEQPLGPGDYIQVDVVAPGFADLRAYFDATNIVDGQPSDLGLAPLGGVVRIEPTDIHLDCSATFPVTITNVAADETLVILGITLHYHYGEGVYGTAFTADFSQVQFPVLLAPGEHLTFPMTFSGGGGPSRAFPTLLTLAVVSGAGEGGTVQYFGGFDRCAAECSGDCDHSGTVTVDELIRAVGIALGNQSVGTCALIDVDADAAVSIAELVAAVDRALSGCGGINRGLRG